MQKGNQTFKLLTMLLLLAACILVGKHVAAEYRQEAVPAGQFSPSNARTEDGALIPAEQFFSAARCVACHQDTHQAWSESLHRNAAREPFYRESADILLRTRGIEFTRHCESCHTPVALFSGALTKSSANPQAPFTKLDDEGLTCSVCHSITEARLDGTGSFTIRRPALLAREDGTPVFGDFTDDQILTDIPGHKRAVMRPLLKSPEFCATCHKVDAPPALNGNKHIRGFSAYDEWQQSGASHETLLPFYRRAERADCRACHMSKVESKNDRAAKQGKIASHQWLGANTAAPLFYQQNAQVEATTRFLQKEVAEIDIFALRAAASDIPLTALTGGQDCTLPPGTEVVAEVVISNRNAAHTFPPEVRDLYEAWVEFEAIDGTGKTLFHSGFLKPDGYLEEGAHVYKQIILDAQGRQITRHQIWTTTIRAYDNAIAPGRSDVARFRFRLPSTPSAVSEMRLRARLKYRRFNQEYTDYVLQKQQRKLTLPVVTMAEAQVQFSPANVFSVLRIPFWKRWNDYGIGLLEQAQYGAAMEAFRQAAALAPDNAALLVNTALAEMGTERFGLELEQFKKAEEWLAAALKLDPANDRARFYRAQVWRAQGRYQEAATELRRLASVWPRDREVQRQLGQTLYAINALPEARQAFEGILRLDPTDFLAWQFLAPLYAAENRQAEAARAQQLYLQWRDDPVADAVAAKFYAAHPEWADERVRAHVHGQHSAARPVLTGAQANPDKP